MKKIVLLISVAFFFSPIFCQTKSRQIKYTRLDQIKKETKTLFGKDQSGIEFSLFSINNIQNDTTVYGVEVNIQTISSEVIATSLALANISSLWGGSASATMEIIKHSGYKVLNYDDLKEIKSFISTALSMRGVLPEKYTVYKLTLTDKIQIGFEFDPDKPGEDYSNSGKFRFIITIDDAVYVTSYKDGIEIVRKLGDYQEELKELSLRE